VRHGRTQQGPLQAQQQQQQEALPACTAACLGLRATWQTCWEVGAALAAQQQQRPQLPGLLLCSSVVVWVT
jgi:hypothetical protein